MNSLVIGVRGRMVINMAETRRMAAVSREMPPVSPTRAHKQEVGGEITYNDFYFSKAKSTSHIKMHKKGAVPKRPTPNYTNAINASATAIPQTATVKKNRSSAGRRRAKPLKKEPKIREQLSKFDYPFFTIVLVLLSFGIVMMFSASYAFALKETGNSYFYVSRQIMFAAVGIAAMIFLSFIDYHILMNKMVLLVGCGVSVALMLMVKITGVTQGGAERWIEIAGITFQPSEILKFAVIMLLAFYAHKNEEKIKDFRKGYLPFLVCLLFACVLTMIQPHLSGTIIIFAIGVTMMFVGNCRVKHILVMFGVFIGLAIIGFLGLKALGYDYFESRFLSFINPEADVLGDTFQTYQSLVTIGSGGMFGLGLGNSRQKFSYLPASHNDFVFSVICEELGFVGAILVILLFILFVYRGFYIAARSRDKFGMMLSVGITVQIGIQALLNIAVVSNSVPNTGISLPFFSYGGTALMMQLAEMGVLLNISRKAAIE